MPVHTKDARKALGEVYEDLWGEIQALLESRPGYRQLFLMLIDCYLWEQYLVSVNESYRGVIAKFNAMQPVYLQEETLLCVEMKKVKSSWPSSPYWLPASWCWEHEMARAELCEERDSNIEPTSGLLYFAWMYASIEHYLRLRLLHQFSKVLSEFLGDAALTTTYMCPMFDERAGFQYVNPRHTRKERTQAQMRELYGRYTKGWFGTEFGGPNADPELLDLNLRRSVIAWVNAEHDRISSNQKSGGPSAVYIVTQMPDGTGVKIEISPFCDLCLYVKVHTAQPFELEVAPDEVNVHRHHQTYEITDASPEESELLHRMFHGPNTSWVGLERGISKMLRRTDYRTPRAAKKSNRSRSEDASVIQATPSIFTGDRFVGKLLLALTNEKIYLPGILPYMVINGDNGRDPTPFFNWVKTYLHDPGFSRHISSFYRVIRFEFKFKSKHLSSNGGDS